MDMEWETCVMGNVYIPDARMTMPELYYPGLKPVGRVRIDKNHRLGAGVKYYNDIDKIRFLVEEDYAGKSFSVLGEADDYINRQYTFFDKTDDVFRLQTFSISLTMTLIDEGSLGNGYIWNSDLRSLIAIGREGAANGYISYVWYNGTFHYLSYPAVQGVPYTIVINKVYAGKTQMFVNGKLHVENTDPTSIQYVEARGGSFGAAQFNTGYQSLRFSVHNFTYRDHILTPEEVLSLYDNPYQFLVPA